jgi:dCTP deaminase
MPPPMITTDADDIAAPFDGRRYCSYDCMGYEPLILSSADILAAIKAGAIKVSPMAGIEKRLGPGSVDFRLGQTFIVFERNQQPYLDPYKPATARGSTRTIRLKRGESFTIHPGELVLAGTIERLTLGPGIMGRLEGRSSLGRLGIIVHSTASIFHPGWDGNPVMELGNLGVMPVKLHPSMRICQFTFEPLSSSEGRPYGSSPADKYSGQGAPVPSRIWDEARVQAEEEDIFFGRQMEMISEEDDTDDAT